MNAIRRRRAKLWNKTTLPKHIQYRNSEKSKPSRYHANMHYISSLSRASTTPKATSILQRGADTIYSQGKQELERMLLGSYTHIVRPVSGAKIRICIGRSRKADGVCPSTRYTITYSKNCLWLSRPCSQDLSSLIPCPISARSNDNDTIKQSTHSLV